MIRLSDLGNTKTAFFIAASCTVLVLVVFGVTKVQGAFGSVELQGYAWSSTIGWISMNCSNESVCGTSDYKVRIMDDMTLTGYGWSENIGWVKFDGLGSSCPGSGSCAARVNPTTEELEGWARACAGTVPGDCTSMADRDDGWEGWISLNCVNNSDCAAQGGVDYQVKVQTGGFAGCNSSTQSCAWGDEVVGWVDWSGVSFTPPCTAGPYACNHDPEEQLLQDQFCNDVGTNPCGANQVCSEDDFQCTELANPVVNDFSADPKIVRAGETTVISWDVTEVTDCTVSGGGDSWTGGPSGSITTSELYNITTYTLRCTPDDGVSSETELGTLTVNVVPTSEEN